jgi:hypothetical protein
MSGNGLIIAAKCSSVVAGVGDSPEQAERSVANMSARAIFFNGIRETVTAAG